MEIGCFKIWLAGVGFMIGAGLVGLVVGSCVGWVLASLVILTKRKWHI
jgi:hypothetical protein